MYSRFKLNAIEDADFYINNYYDLGLKYTDEYKRNLKSRLRGYIDYNMGYIDGDKLEKEWFREIDADVFLSHSHSDEVLAISIAGWLRKEMGLNAFVDSCAWGHANDLLGEINNTYNILREEDDGSVIYSHSKANYAASHIYLMLSSALNNMINKTECLIFINTPNSIIQMDKSAATAQTLSPWIYNEIVMANTMKITQPNRPIHIEKGIRHYAEMNEDANITHKLDFSDFIDIDLSIFKKWESRRDFGEHSLDTLYKITRKQGDILHG